MIKLGNKEISAIRLGSNVISAVYKGKCSCLASYQKLLWQRMVGKRQALD